MIDEKRKRSILNSLAQPEFQPQVGPPLASSFLRWAEIKPFLRKIERIITEQELRQSVVLYWCSNDAVAIMPARTELLELRQGVLACTAFSEHRPGPQDEFCFAVIGSELAVGIYGYCAEVDAEGPVYECSGSFDPSAVKRLFQTLSPYLEFIDPLEADRLEAVISRSGLPKTAPHFANSLGHYWTELKAPAAPTANSGAPTPKTAKQQSNFAPVEDPWFRLTGNYPYPIANPFRTLESITNPSEKYKEQLKLAENLLALLAGMCLSISAQNEPRILADLRDSVAVGVSMGHWREMIRKSTVAWRSSSTKDIPLAKAIGALRIEQTTTGFGKAVEQLIRTRNDFAHHRGPTAESQIEKDTVRLDALLRECINFTEFLCHHPIRIVKTIDVLPSGALKMICLKAIGDHPALRQEELCLSRGFPKGHLILDSGDSNWLSLYPFLTQDICPSCGTMEIYHLDKWRYDKNLIQVRSFERGHAQESTAISTHLKSIVPTN